MACEMTLQVTYVITWHDNKWHIILCHDMTWLLTCNMTYHLTCDMWPDMTCYMWHLTWYYMWHSMVQYDMTFVMAWHVTLLEIWHDITFYIWHVILHELQTCNKICYLATTARQLHSPNPACCQTLRTCILTMT